MQADELVREGRLDEALQTLTKQVREDPADAKLRVFLFQLLSVMGQWDRALTQLNVAGEMDPANLLMAQVCGSALNCEALRGRVFAGERSPLVFGEPADWIGLLVEACRNVARGHYEAASELRDRAFEAAPPTAGQIDGQAFEWIADGDTRLGPVLEAIVEGRYYWVPFSAIREIRLEEPTDLRDTVWLPAQITWANEGTAVALIPARYCGSEAHEDSAVRMGRRTEWLQRAGGSYLGMGQRMLVTDQGEYPLLTTRHITFKTNEREAGGDEGGA